MPDDPDELKTVKDNFEKECRARPESLPEITWRYFLKRFDIQASRLKQSGSELPEGDYPKALGQLVQAEVGEATKLVTTTWRSGRRLPFLKKLKDFLLKQKADLETEAWNAKKLAQDKPVDEPATTPACSGDAIEDEHPPRPDTSDLPAPPVPTAETKVVAHQDPVKPRGKDRKGDATLLSGKRLVTFGTAEEYLGISDRQRQKLMNRGKLKFEGEGQNRRITVESLLAYRPADIPN